MKTIGIIAEYNPFHAGHAYHINESKRLAGGECAVVCIMSGNFVQRGDFAVFEKHARAKAAVYGGADLIIELPSPYALLSAEGFARAGVFLLESLGVCDYLSFGSESGDAAELTRAAEAIITRKAEGTLREWLDKGAPYALAQQKAARAVLGAGADVFRSPNNLLGVEYIKAIAAAGSVMQPMTVRRAGGEHDGSTGWSASAIREKLEAKHGTTGLSQVLGAETYAGRGMAGLSPAISAEADAGRGMAGLSPVISAEISAGRGPVTAKAFELAVLSRLRALDDLSGMPGVSEGLDRRFLRYIASEATVGGILNKVKTKRYAMSRLRRTLICACLGITADETAEPPPYIRVLAMNGTGMGLLREIGKHAALPVITKPASAKKLSGRAGDMFRKEAAATDFYVLGYPAAEMRTGGQEWKVSPAVCG